MSDKATKEMVKQTVELSRAFSHAFQGEHGQIIINHLSKMFWLGRTSFVDGKPYLSAYQEGERNVLLYLLKMSKTDPVEVSNRLEQLIKNESKENRKEEEKPPWLI